MKTVTFLLLLMSQLALANGEAPSPFGYVVCQYLAQNHTVSLPGKDADSPVSWPVDRAQRGKPFRRECLGSR